MQTTQGALFAAGYPYCLTDRNLDKLLQAQALVSCMCQLAAHAAPQKPNESPMFTLEEFHVAMWAIGDMLDEAMKKEVSTLNLEGEQA